MFSTQSHIDRRNRTVDTTTPKKRGRKAATTEQPVMQEVVVMIPLTELHPFPDHPFQVRDDDSMRETAESVKENGVIVPGLVRPREEGGYELIAGHRRKYACELAGLTAMPVIVRDIDRDTATIVMVDSNLQRESILPSERAKAYKMKLEAIRRRAGRPAKDVQENSPKISANFRSDDEIGQEAGVSGDTIRNYISLTHLVPELQQMVDDKKIALTPAYQLAALTPGEQAMLLETIDSEQATPSLSQAQRMKKLSQSGELNEDTMLSIMMEQKKPEKNDITLSGEKLRKYFPRSYTPFQIEATIFKLLDAWQRKRQRDQSR
ncbi:MAG: ParB/RepB/Spo0J family partition protein [Faecousia sp.]